MQTLLFEELAQHSPSSHPEACIPSESLLALAEALPTNIYLGTSSWAFPGWANLVYDNTYEEKQLAREGLAAYAQHPLLRCVSIDRTFYAPIDAATYRRYADQVPEAFRFAVKAPSALLSPVRMHDHAPNPDYLNADRAEEIFFSPLLTLESKLGWALLQCPPLPDSVLQAPQHFFEGLGEMLKRARQLGIPTVVEVRDRALLTPELVELLTSHQARLCLSLHPRLPTLPTQFRIQAAFPPGPLFIRWNLNRHLSYNAARERYAPFHIRQDPDDEAHCFLASQIRRWHAEGHPVWVLVNNKAEGCAPLTIQSLVQTLIA